MRDFLRRENLSFTPEALEVVVQAFDEAWAAVERSDGVTDENRADKRIALARRIVELSDMAQGNSRLLRDSAVASFGIKKTNGQAAP